MAHAKFSPSQSKTWLKCALFPSMNEQFPSVDSPASKEGTRLHDVAETCLKDGTLPDNNEDRQILTPYVGMVLNTFQNAYKGILLIEEKVEIFEDDCWGKLDAAVIEPDRHHLYDFKSGTSPVPAKENPQLILYSIGLLKKYPLHPDDPVEMVIDQPRRSAKGDRKDPWRAPAGEILSWEPKFRKAIARGKKEDPPAVAGKHCWFCPGKMYCKEYLLSRGAG